MKGISSRKQKRKFYTCVHHDVSAGAIQDILHILFLKRYERIFVELVIVSNKLFKTTKLCFVNKSDRHF
jgi:hypothetical protein